MATASQGSVPPQVPVDVLRNFTDEFERLFYMVDGIAKIAIKTHNVDNLHQIHEVVTHAE